MSSSSCATGDCFIMFCSADRSCRMEIDVPWSPVERASGLVRIVHISDTHNRHRELQIPDGDILIVSGDFSHKGDWRAAAGGVPASILDFNAWLGELNHGVKIVIAGNHEIGFDRKVRTRQDCQALLSNAIYLQDSSVDVLGIKIHGSPWTASSNMGFSKSRRKLPKKWQLIPPDVDVLVTHAPPLNIFDLADCADPSAAVCDVCGKSHPFWRHWGDHDLRTRVVSSLRPKVHLFGHVHNKVGGKIIDGVTFINSACDVFMTPHVFDFCPAYNRANHKQLSGAQGAVLATGGT